MHACYFLERYLSFYFGSLGLIGAVQVAYQTRRIENSVQAANIGQRSLEFFSSPILGRLLSSYNQPPPSSFTLEGCAAQCLDEPLCLSFSFSGTTKACERHTQFRTDSGANFQSDQFLFLFYEKNVTMVQDPNLIFFLIKDKSFLL